MHKYFRNCLIKTAGFFNALNQRLSTRKKVILSYLFLILVPACILMCLYYQRSSSIIENGITNSILQTIKQTEINISYKLNAVENISDMLFMNNNLHAFLGRDDEDTPIGQRIDDWKELNEIILGAQNNKDIFKIRVFLSSKKLYSGELNNFLPMEPIQEEGWYSDILDRNGRIYWRDTVLERYINNQYLYVISCMRMMRDWDSYDDLVGILSIDTPESNIYEIISKVDIADKQGIFIINSMGKIVSCYDKTKLGSQVFNNPEIIRELNSDEGILKKRINGREMYIIHKGITGTGWRLITQIPVSEIGRNNNTFSSISGVIIIVSTLIIFMLALFLFEAFLTEGIHRRVKTLIHTMKKEGMESITDGYPARDGDIYRLEKSFDKMIKTVKMMTEESYQSKLREREAELKALQAQINPHFLYNTLDIINWMAIRRDAEDISTMVDSIAKYFRYSLSKGRDIVRISDEIALIEVYVDIQKKRFGDVFTVLYHIDDEVKQYHIPKLTIQPLIENAISHGILEKEDGYREIRIDAGKNGEDISITIHDNGVGIREEKLKELLKYEKSNSNNSYGLYSVNERIKLFSVGEKYGVFISSRENEGTMVEVRFKAV